MQLQSTTARSDIHAKREWLKEIVARLGPTAVPAAIREEAYRVGFGFVSAHLLVWVRNNLWPDRERHAGGRVFGCTAESSVVAAETIGGLPSCPCGSSNVRIRRTNDKRNDGSARRHFNCKDCRSSFSIVISPEEAKRPAVPSRRLLAKAAAEKRCSKCKLVLPVEAFGLKKTVESHGLTLEQYEAMLAAQAGVCAICKCEQTTKRRYRLSIDHCHETGVARGLLCELCNQGIGCLRDDPKILETALEYLRRFKG